MPPTSLRRFLAPSSPKSLSLSGNTTRFYFILFYFILYIFVFSAHYDSRNTNVNDNTGRAPGADDTAAAALPSLSSPVSSPRSTRRLCTRSALSSSPARSRDSLARTPTQSRSCRRAPRSWQCSTPTCLATVSPARPSPWA